MRLTYLASDCFKYEFINITTFMLYPYAVFVASSKHFSTT